VQWCTVLPHGAASGWCHPSAGKTWGHAAADGGLLPRSGRWWSWTPIFFNNESRILSLRWRPSILSATALPDLVGRRIEPGRNPCFALTTATPAGAVSFLKALLWPRSLSPFLKQWGKPLCLTRQAMRRRRLGVVSSLGAPCELLAESLGNWWSWFWSQNRAGQVRAQCTPSPGVSWQRLLLVQSEPAVYSPILLLGIGVGGTLLRAVPSEVVRRMLWNRL
jgi:hypothetical protein